jgi:uncharacterized phage protein (TIGR01671 family)
MNREIKFRAWDYDKKIFLPAKTYAILSVTDFGATGIMLTDFENYKEGEYFYPNTQQINQYTGLKDSKGTEIYEGDIVRWDDGSKGDYWRVAKCVWSEKNSFAFEIIPNKSINCYENGRTHTFNFGNFIYTPLPSAYNNVLEIIGNIYEKPELPQSGSA